MSRTVFTGGSIFDGKRRLAGHALVVDADGVVVSLSPDAGAAGATVDLGGDILAPGYVDLQVNGGGGVMLNDAPTVETLARMAEAHRALGATTLLPTLITDRRQVTDAAIAAVVEAIDQGVRGIGGLHLEGPHLSLARKGAHDGALIRPMEDGDLDGLLDAAQRLPVLLVTIAPESVTLPQVRRLAEAGVHLSLGHTDADYETCVAYAKAGVSLATHLFNAMSQFGSRAPGLVGAALDTGALSAGLIADGVHVHPAAMRRAFAAKAGPGRIFLVSDAMAVAGTEETGFRLNGREITRQGGRLTLADGTLAGADLDLTRAIRVLVEDVGLPVEAALAAATSVPADVVGLPLGRIRVGEPVDLIRIKGDLSGVTPV